MNNKKSTGSFVFWTEPLFLLKKGDAVGKTKVGKGTKVMMVSDGNGLPLSIHIASAQPHEIRLAEKTLRGIRVPQPCGRPKTRPKILIADRAYDSQSFRKSLQKRGIKPCIPTRNNRRVKHGRVSNVLHLYRHRWKIERCFAWMDQFRRLVVRFERQAMLFKGFCFIACIIWTLNTLID